MTNFVEILHHSLMLFHDNYNKKIPVGMPWVVANQFHVDIGVIKEDMKMSLLELSDRMLAPAMNCLASNIPIAEFVMAEPLECAQIDEFSIFACHNETDGKVGMRLTYGAVHWEDGSEHPVLRFDIRTFKRA